MRDLYVSQLERLKTEIVEMSVLCQEALEKASAALLEGDEAKANEALAYSVLIDDKEYVVEALCSSLILQQQPVAGDYRLISTSSKIVGNLSRIGTQAVDIGEIVLRKEYNKRPVTLDYFKELAKDAQKMIHDVMQAFEEKNVLLAREVKAYDDVVDEHFYKTKHNLAGMLKQADSREETDYALDLLMIDKYYERIGDHVVKIAEAVEYYVTNQMPKAND
ncbi:MAG: phosphate signaling complex protein PhoU [Peptococcaceae bacterium]|nr:phosphate signaling complex protein PhoU [Peptococcaceae bacterium]